MTADEQIAAAVANMVGGTEPTPDTVRTIMLWLNSHSYAVAIFTPSETENVDDMDALESAMIAAGNNYIAEQE